MRIIILCLLLLFIPCGLIQAHPLNDMNSVTDLILAAINNDYDVQISDLQIAEINKSFQRLEASLRPQLNLSGEYMLENLANQPLGGLYVLRGADYEDIIHTRSSSLTVVQQIGLNNQLKTAFQETEIGKDLGQLQRKQVIHSLTIKVQESYNNLLKAYSGVQLASKAVDYANFNLQITMNKLDNGNATPLDVLRDKNDLITAQNQLAAATNALDVSLLALLQQIGYGLEQLEISESWAEQLYKAYSSQVQKWIISYEQVLEYGLNNRIELKMLRKMVEQAAINHHSIVGNKDWSLNLNGHYLIDDFVLQGSLDSERRLIGTLYHSKATYPEVKEFDENDFWENLPEELKIEELERLQKLIKELEGSIGIGDIERDVNPWQVTFSLNYRFGDGGAKKAEQEQAALAIKKAELEYEKAREGISLEIFALYQQLNQGWRALELSRLLQEEALETYKKLEEMLQIGLITDQELLEGDLLVSQTEHGLLSAMLDYQEYQTKLAQAIGLDLVELISGIAYGKWPQDGILEAKGRLNL